MYSTAVSSDTNNKSLFKVVRRKRKVDCRQFIGSEYWFLVVFTSTPAIYGHYPRKPLYDSLPLKYNGKYDLVIP